LKVFKWIGLALVIVVLASMVTACGEKEVTGDIIALTNVNVIPMDQERVMSDQTVIIREGRISEIGPSASIKIPSGATKIDGTGKYLIPALADMHVHMVGEAWNIMFPPEAQFSAEDLDFSKFIFPYVANGVTTIQVMSALPEHVALRDQISRGEVLGPRLILARMIDGPEKAWPPPISTWVKTPAEARQAVMDAKEAGYDKIKVYSFLNQESYDSIIATAKEVDIPVDGHIPMDLSVEYILDKGQNLIAHAEEVMKHAQGNYDQERIDYFAKIISESDTWITPTLITMRSIIAIFDDYEEGLARPEARYLQHPMHQGVWSYLIHNVYLPMTPEHRQKIRDGFELFQRPLTKALYDRGVKLMAGTDTLLPFLVPGFALHHELEELVDVGLTPYEALRTSTTHPFEFLGELDEAGTVEVGKRADLVLLEANPLEDITNSQKIAGVMTQGRWLSKTELQDGLEELVAYYDKFKVSYALQGLLNQQVKEQDILGMAMAVRLADGTVIGKASGYSDPSGEEAWSVDTVCAIGSVTKTFTGVVVMQLVEEGKISLDDTIDTWFPEQPNGDRITVRMLLSHTSGLANYISGENVMEGKWTKEWAPMELLAEANKLDPMGEPGSSEAHYSNTNYLLLGLIVEKITGNSWAQEVESRIIKPLDLKDTTFLSKEGVLDIMVGGYTKTEDSYQNLLEEPWYPHPSTVWSAGEIVTTVSDLMTFASALLDGELVSRETLAVMAQPLGIDVSTGRPWGLGGAGLEIDGLRAFGMGGDIPGYHAFFAGFLDNKIVVTAACNTLGGDVITPSMSKLQYISQAQ